MAWAHLPATVRDRFDLVTWDPRGVGSTTPAPVPCGDVPSEPRVPPTGPVNLSTVAATAIASTGRALAACEAANAIIAPHLGTMEVVEDLERLRVAVGDVALTYWGVSYGTELGYAYAVTHPDHVRAILLDSPMDPGPWSIQRLADGAEAHENGYRMFARFHPQSAALLEDALAHLGRHPVALSSGRTLDRWSAYGLVTFMTAFQTMYGDAARAIDLLHDVTDGTPAQRAAARVRLGALLRSFDQEWTGPGWWTGPAIFCTDVSARPDLQAVLSTARHLRRTVSLQAAVETTTAAAMCKGLTLAPDPVPTLAAGAGPSVPVLVIGSTHDGRTNGAWIPRMTQVFPTARSITYSGGQHGLYGTVGSSCVDDSATRFLITTMPPTHNRMCPNTYVPGGLVD